MEINNIIENKIPEGQDLEFKKYYFENGKFSNLKDSEKNSLVKEITAFANSEGGTIIIGITEDDFHNPSQISDVGVDEDTFEMWEQSFRQYISAKIKPVLYGIECNLQEYQESNIIVIKIPKSMLKPHALNDGNKDTFYIRYGNTVNSMRLEELRLAFQSREIIEQKILTFRDERIAKLYSGEQIGELGNKSLLLLHIIPEWSIDINSYVNLKELKEDYKLVVFSPNRYQGSARRVGIESYNHDGLRIEAVDSKGALESYTQAFHNGIIESVEIRGMNKLSHLGDDQPVIYRWDRFEEYLAIKLRELVEVLVDFGIAKPYYLFVSLLNVRGRTSTYGEWSD